MGKIWNWILATGLKNLGLAAAVILLIIFQPMLWYEASIVCATLFFDVNWVYFRKQINKLVK